MSGLLLLDCGNSRIKWQWRCAGSVKEQGVWTDVTMPPAVWCLMNPEVIWGSSVRSADAQQAVERIIGQLWDVPVVWAASTAQLAGVVNAYLCPERLGIDRWLTLLACRERFMGPCVIVDAGTALTVDFLGADGQHAGGYIIPGVGLMHDALCQGTARLRVPWELPQNMLPGRQTGDAINRGLMLLMAGMLREVQQQAQDLWPGKDVQWVLTGGDASILGSSLNRLCGEVHQLPDLVLDGLYLWGKASLYMG